MAEKKKWKQMNKTVVVKNALLSRDRSHPLILMVLLHHLSLIVSSNICGKHDSVFSDHRSKALKNFKRILIHFGY